MPCGTGQQKDNIMLLELHVKNFALIDEADLTFREGFNILTGETGSGKSILIGSVTCALGGKTSREVVREGAEYASVELEFESSSKEAKNILAKNDLPDEDGHYVISRRIQSNGRTVTRINGETCSQNAVKELAECLLDIHGQHEHQSLLYTKNHLLMLDRFSKDEEKSILENLKTAYDTYRTCQKELEESTVDTEERLRETEYLKYICNEIESAGLKPGEEQELETEYRRLKNSRSILEAVGGCRDYIDTGNGSAAENITYGLKALSRAADYDEKVKEFSNELSEIENLLNDLNRELSSYLDGMDGDEGRLDEVTERLDLIHHLESRFGGTEEKVLLHLEESRGKLAKYEDYDAYTAKLEAKLKEAERELEDYSKELTKVRESRARVLEKLICEALLELNFEQVQFKIEVRDSGHFSANGRDEAEFLISMNPGEPFRPLAKVASGGELSRIMLGIKSVLADKDSVETLIFDEIDTGISGRTAQKVAERMAVIAGSRQVICITHLPQIASMADAHYLIEKTTDGTRTVTSVRELDAKSETEEIARLVGGARITDSVMENAAEMKALANEVKKQLRNR